MPAKNLIYFEDLALSLEKDKKSFFHGVHKQTWLPPKGCYVFFCAQNRDIIVPRIIDIIRQTAKYNLKGGKQVRNILMSQKKTWKRNISVAQSAAIRMYRYPPKKRGFPIEWMRGLFF